MSLPLNLMAVRDSSADSGQAGRWMWDVQKPSEMAVACGVRSKGTLWSVGHCVDSLPTPRRAVAEVPPEPRASLLALCPGPSGQPAENWALPQRAQPPLRPDLWNFCPDFPDTLGIKSH